MTLPRLLLDEAITVSLDRPEVVLPQLLALNTAAKVIIINQEVNWMNSPAEVMASDWHGAISRIKDLTSLPIMWYDFGAGGPGYHDAWMHLRKTGVVARLDHFCRNVYPSLDMAATRDFIAGDVKFIAGSLRVRKNQKLYGHTFYRTVPAPSNPLRPTIPAAELAKHIAWCVSVGFQGFTNYLEDWETLLNGDGEVVKRCVPPDLHVLKYIELKEAETRAIVRANAKGWVA